jgi:pilus assembly protein CpaE
MLTAISLALDSGTLELLREQLHRQQALRIIRNFADYPAEEELAAYVLAAAPAIAFVNMRNMDQALRLATTVDRAGTGTQIIALDQSGDPEVLVHAMRAGIRELVSIPFDSDKLNDSVQRIADLLEIKPLAVQSSDSIYAFLPAKPGGGTSTIAMNLSCAIARTTKTRTLLADFDLNLGMISFQLKLTNTHSVVDALQLANEMDESIWNSLVTPVGDLHVLCSGRLDPGRDYEEDQVRKILDFARRMYQTICVDLSGNMEPYSIELLSQAKEIFLVCTPDVSSLHLAVVKTRFLREMGLGSRVSVLMNRSEKRNLLSSQETEKVLGVPVRFSFANDPRRVGDALSAGGHVDPKSELGRQFDAFAESLTVSSVENKGPGSKLGRRFVEYFAITPQSSYAKKAWTETTND